MRYCIGDVHGCYKTLTELIQKINKTDNEAVFYFVGDNIDRGPNSKSVLDFLMDLKSEILHSFAIKGNHEQMLLDAYKNDISFNETMWYVNNAEPTVNSFSIESYYYKNTKNLIPTNYFEFINKLPYYIELEDFIIVHAGFNFHIEDPFSDKESMLWTREEIYIPEKIKGKKIIHGHTPISLKRLSENLENKNLNIIDVDTGCVYNQYPGYGYLSAFNLDKFELIYTKNVDIN